MKQNLRTFILGLSVLSTLNLQPSTGFAQGTAFTYQGRLEDNDSPANGSYDFRFALYDSVTNGVEVGALTNGATVVTDGLFTVTLDFGAAVFDGSERWIEVAAATNGAGVFTVLNPRQRVTATPYAIKAGSLAGGLSGTYSETVSFTNPSNQFTGVFTGDGSGLTNIAAATLGGLSASNFWQLGGNTGTTAGVDSLGTADNQPLELHVNGQRALRLEPAPETPNVIGGSASNSIPAGIRAATIAGGGLPAFPNQVTADFATVGGGTFHIAGGAWSTIAGGRDNRVYAESSGVLSGRANLVESNALGSVIVGGEANAVREGSIRAFIGSGFRNDIQTNTAYSVIVGGVFNTNESAASYAAIGGGIRNRIETNALYAVVDGGINNSAGGGFRAVTVGGGEANRAAANHATVAGGLNNTNAGPGATIGGGNENTTLANDTVIAGGIINSIASNSIHSVISGGRLNVIEAGSQNATVSGGSENVAGRGEATVSGGAFNRAFGFSSTVGGGGGNTVTGNWATVSGGLDNTVETNGSTATIAGGWLNRIGEFSYHGVVGGGYSNRLETNAYASTIAGGEQNTVAANAWKASLGGGAGNTVQAFSGGTIGGGLSNTVSGSYATVPGGLQNTAAGSYSHAGGRRAKANHSGSSVWADSTDADFASTAANQFLIRASGGVGINTNSPTAKLHIAGTPGVDGIRFPDGTLQTSAAVTPALPQVVFISGFGTNPATTNNFLAVPVVVTVTSSSQQILVTSHKAFGSSAVGGAGSLSLYIGYRPPGGAITTVGGGIFGNQVAQNTRVTMGMSAVITSLTPGTYQVGLVGSSSTATNWNSNEYSYTTAVVY